MPPTITSPEPPLQAQVRLENLPGASLDAAITAARLAEPVLGLDDRTFVFVPRNFELVDKTDPFKLPPRIEQKLVVDDRASLVAYVNRFLDERSVILADFDSGSVTARLDWHTSNMLADEEALRAQPCRHTATLALRPSEEFKRWSKVQGELMAQAEFAAFLEENAVDIVDPEPGVMIEISRDLEATQGASFKSSTRLENGDRGFIFETETRVRGEVKVPREFVLRIPLYHGEDAVDLRCAFRWRFSGGGLAMGFEWRRVEYQRRAHFTLLATAVAEATGCPVFFGRVP